MDTYKNKYAYTKLFYSNLATIKLNPIGHLSNFHKRFQKE